MMTTAIGLTISCPAIEPRTTHREQSQAPVSATVVTIGAEALLGGPARRAPGPRRLRRRLQVLEATDEHEHLAERDGEDGEEAGHRGQGDGAAVDPRRDDAAAPATTGRQRKLDDGQPPAAERRLQQQEDAERRAEGEEQQPPLGALPVLVVAEDLGVVLEREVDVGQLLLEVADDVTHALGR